MSEFACPNGHPFPLALAVKCDECEATVLCVPHADAMRLHEALERAEADLARERAARRIVDEALREALDRAAE